MIMQCGAGITSPAQREKLRKAVARQKRQAERAAAAAAKKPGVPGTFYSTERYLHNGGKGRYSDAIGCTVFSRSDAQKKANKIGCTYIS